MESLKTSNLSQPFSNVKLLWRVFSRTKLQHRLSYLINEFFLRISDIRFQMIRHKKLVFVLNQKHVKLNYVIVVVVFVSSLSSCV